MGKAGAKRFVSLLERRASVAQVLGPFRLMLRDAIAEFNGSVSRNTLIRNHDEQMPDIPKQIAGVRARMGTYLEVVFASILGKMISQTSDKWRLTFNCVTEYPDLYVRDKNGSWRIRIEVKTLHDESIEGASRFDTWTKLLKRDEDILVLLGWRWETKATRAGSIHWPQVIAGDALSAWDIAQERDTRHRIVGGKFGPQGQPHVVSTKTGKLVDDPGNYGKMQRIVHLSRLNGALSSDVRRMLTVLGQIYPTDEA